MSQQPADFVEQRWRRSSDAEAAGEPLSASDREFLARYTPRSAEARAEAQLFEALARLADGPEDDGEPANSPLVNATVQHVLAARRQASPSTPDPTPMSSGSSGSSWSSGSSRSSWSSRSSRSSGSSRSRRIGAVAGVVAAMAAMAILWVSIPRDTEPGPRITHNETTARGEAQTSPATHEVIEAGEPAPSRTNAEDPESEPTLVADSGQWVDEAGSALAAGPLPPGVLRVASEEGCVGLAEVVACFEQGSRLDVAESPVRIEVLEGEGVVRAPSFTTHTMIVEVAGARYMISSEVTVRTAVYSRDSSRVEVIEGRVERVGPAGEREILEAGAIRDQTHAGRSVAVPDTKTLLAKARASRSAGDREAAIAYYEKLLRLHPRSSVSKAAMVSLGDLYLDVGKPAAALRWFGRYLDRGGGTLSQEAHLGRIKALGALGRTTQKQRAIEDFRRAHPESRYIENATGGAKP